MDKERVNEILYEYFHTPSKVLFNNIYKETLLKRMGEKCVICGSADCVEFAHIKSSDVGGTGRGRVMRLIDIDLNNRCYRLMCKRCHSVFDILQLQYSVENRACLHVARKIINSNPDIKLSDMMTFNGDRFVLRKQFASMLK